MLFFVLFFINQPSQLSKSLVHLSNSYVARATSASALRLAGCAVLTCLRHCPALLASACHTHQSQFVLCVSQRPYFFFSTSYVPSPDHPPLSSRLFLNASVICQIADAPSLRRREGSQILLSLAPRHPGTAEIFPGYRLHASAAARRTTLRLARTRRLSIQPCPMKASTKSL